MMPRSTTALGRDADVTEIAAAAKPGRLDAYDSTSGAWAARDRGRA